MIPCFARCAFGMIHGLNRKNSPLMPRMFASRGTTSEFGLVWYKSSFSSGMLGAISLSTFWKRYKELSDWKKVIDKIEKGEQKIQRKKDIQSALDNKVRDFKNPWMTLHIDYGPNKGKAFTEGEDRFLICMLQQLGYGSWEQLKLEIRKAWQFRTSRFRRTPMSPCA